jgi:hypothetical protein
MNLREIQRSRKKPVPGDVFAMFMPGRGWLYGRVVATDALIGPFEDCLLLYIYRHVSGECRAPDDLSPELLVPPILTDTFPWKKGYFKTIAHVPLRRDQLLPVHCFYSPVRSHYFNEKNQQLDHRTEPCGFYALTTERGIDGRISEALGVPSAAYDDDSVANSPPVDPDDLPAGSEEGECSVSLHLPVSRGAADPAEVEEALIEAVETSRVGAWVGHGSDMQTGAFDVQFVGPDGPALLLAIKRVLEPLRGRLPQGWYVTARVGDDGVEQRVTL